MSDLLSIVWLAISIFILSMLYKIEFKIPRNQCVVNCLAEEGKICEIFIKKLYFAMTFL